MDTENGSPAESLLSAEGELAEEVGDSPGTPRDTEEEATLSDEFYSHDTDDEDDQGKKRRDRTNSVSSLFVQPIAFHECTLRFLISLPNEIFSSRFHS